MQAVRELDERLQQSERWSPDAMLAWQRRQLGLLVNHARRTTPFYRFRLNGLFGPTGLIDWRRWAELPILTRTDVADRFDALLSRAPVADHGPFADVISSGSTGTPIKIRTTRVINDAVSACNWRAQRWWGIDWSKRLLSRVYSGHPGRHNGDKLGPWGPPWDKTAARGQHIYSSSSVMEPELLDLILAHRPSYVALGTPLIETLSDAVLARGLEVKIECFFVRGAGADARLRELAHKHFGGARVLELYSAKESGPIAHPCPVSGQLHVNDETILVEVVDANNRPCAPGEEGRVLVTPFGSTAMPLIRYELGDTAVAGTPCPCGRCLSTLDGISGRVSHAFRHPDGRSLFARLALEPLQAQLAVRRWQIAQTGATQFEVRYLADADIDEQGRARFVETFHRELFDDAVIRFLRVEALPLTDAGKFIEYRREYDAQSI
ncbi:MAG: hypothetical protein J0I99_08010 [Devosia sp.]|uniref:phenylacetate--CoA ligase family protein n=1 Tax=Devosia sp. TaxID=1871048 RepID=UPI001AC9A844|nr:hypothetical protein [Devosia sp.]MBN9315666.1 hypothetical protein [Devosia sp.]